MAENNQNKMTNKTVTIINQSLLPPWSGIRMTIIINVQKMFVPVSVMGQLSTTNNRASNKLRYLQTQVFDWLIEIFSVSKYGNRNLCRVFRNEIPVRIAA